MKRSRRLLGVILCLTMIMSQFTAAAFADDVNGEEGIGVGTQIDEPKEGTMVSAIVDDSGVYDTETTFHVGGKEDMAALSSLVNEGKNFAEKTVVLDGDITLEGSFTPIGSNSNLFAGIFDGKGHAVSGLLIEGETDYQALFGGVSGSLRDLTVTGSVKGKQYVAGICAWATAGASFSNLINGVEVVATAGNTAGVVAYGTGTSTAPITLENCKNQGNVTGGGDYTAGVVSQIKTGYLEMANCSNDVNATITGSGNCTAGVVGDTAAYASVEGCYNAGSVSQISEKTPTGGVIGKIGSNCIKIEGCYNAGSVTGSGTYTGGVIGEIGKGNKGVIKYCYNKGTITSTGTYVGGITGFLNGGTWSYSGTPTPSDITYSYNRGEITGTGGETKVGGIAGLCKEEATTKIDHSYNSGILNGVSIGAIAASGYGNCTDNFYLNSSIENPVDIKYATALSQEEWTNGKAAYLLDEGEADNRKNIWGQEEGNPVISSSQVYKITINSDNEVVYNGNPATELYITKNTAVELNANPKEKYILDNTVIKSKDGSEIDKTLTDDFLAVGKEPSNTTKIEFTTPSNGMDVVIDCSYISKPENIGEEAKITLDANGGKIHGENNEMVDTKEISTVIGGRLEKPDTPENGYYKFRGWFKDKKCTIAYSFGNVITESTTLYAGWLTDADYYDVIFDGNGGSFSGQLKEISMKLISGETPLMSEKPDRIGFLFRGWFEDAECTMPYDFSTGITQPTRIYAGWQSLGIGQPGDEGYVPRQYLARFDANGGYFSINNKKVSFVEQLVNDGDKVVMPQEPTKDDNGTVSYVFDGWASAADGTAPTAEIKSNVTFSAKWAEMDSFDTLIQDHGDSEEDAIEIPNLGTLEKLRDYVNKSEANSCAGKYFVLKGNIQLPSDWVSIGVDSFKVPYLRGSKKGFAGDFNGNSSEGYKIYYANNQNASLFGAIKGGIVHDLDISGGSVNSLGGLADTVANATVSDCTIMTTINNPNNGIGGFSYYGYGGNLTNCTLKTGSVLNGGMTAGGIVAVITSMGASGIVGCKTEDGVKINAVGAESGIVYGIGGIVGYSCGNVKDCYNGADIMATYSGGSKATGGIVGLANSMGVNNITGCINAGDVTVTGTNASNAGGIFGAQQGQKVTIKDCISFGKIDAVGKDVNTITGDPLESKVSMNNSFYANDYKVNTDPFDGKGATGLPLADFKSGKVAYLIKTDTEEKWTQNELEKHPELGTPDYYMSEITVENPEYGSANLGATAKSVEKTSTVEGELYIPFDTDIKVNATPKADEVVTDSEGTQWKYVYSVSSIVVKGSGDPTVIAGGSFLFNEDKTAVTVTFDCTKTKVPVPVIVIPPGNGDGNNPGDNPGEGTGDGDGIGNGDGTGNGDGAGTGDKNNGNGNGNSGNGNTNNGNLTGNNSSNGQATANNSGNNGTSNTSKKENSNISGSDSVQKIEKIESANAVDENKDKTDTPSESGGSSRGGSVFKIISDTVKENPLVLIGILAAVAAIIASGAYRRKRKEK